MITASDKDAELWRCKHENFKLRTKNYKFKKHLVYMMGLFDQSTKNEWNFSQPPRIPRRSHKNTKNHRHERTKLSSTRIQPSYAPADISSIHSLIEDTDNGTNAESADLSIISSTSSFSLSSVSLATENETYKTALTSNSQDSLIITTDITTFPPDAVRDASQFNHFDSILIPEPSFQCFVTHTNPFIAPSIIRAVEEWCEKYTAEFSIDELLPQTVEEVCEEYTSQISIDELLPQNNCECCLCQLREKHADTFEFCIKQHPLEKCCRRGLPKHRNNHQLKYQKLPLCDECISSMTMKAKKTKSTEYRCCFNICAEKFKTRAKLESHIKSAKHLNVKNFICNLCDKDFYSKSGLKSHERRHLMQTNLFAL